MVCANCASLPDLFPLHAGERARSRLRHPLTRGIEPFETTDELYLMERHGDLHVLLDTEFAGEATGFDEHQWAQDRHPVMYIKAQGEGAVLYNTLGHCRSHYDMQPFLDWWPTIDRCAWDLPVFYDLLRRGIAWCKGESA